MSQESIIDKLKEFSNQHQSLLIVGIFGSWASGASHAKSDLDIVVSKQTPLEIVEKTDLLSKLSLIIGLEIDLVDLSTAHGILFNEIVQNVIWIKKDPVLFGQLLSKHIINEADFKIYRDRIMVEKQKRFLKR